MYSGGHFTILLIALLADRFIGDPETLWRRVPHPVVWVGMLIDVFERTFNHDTYSPLVRRVLGTLTIVILILFSWWLDTGCVSGWTMRRLPVSWSKSPSSRC
jgi:cobalamin biosynthesis protein CobD/CbiB